MDAIHAARGDISTATASLAKSDASEKEDEITARTCK